MAPGHQRKEGWLEPTCHCQLPSLYFPSSFTHATYPMPEADFSLSLPFIMIWSTGQLSRGAKEILHPQSLSFKTNAFLQTQKSFKRDVKGRVLNLSLCIPAVALLILPPGKPDISSQKMHVNTEGAKKSINSLRKGKKLY